jgi:stalled ribosome rescue protein Dom34
MTKGRRKRRYKRGYPVALLVGFENDHAIMWQVFSQVIKKYCRFELRGKRNDERLLYNFHESIIDAWRPLLTEGTGSIVVTAPMKTTYTRDFLDHVQKHHIHMIQSKKRNRANFAELVGSADKPQKVAELVKDKKFSDLIKETISGEADHIVNILEKNLYNTGRNVAVLYSLKEIEAIVYDRRTSRRFNTEYLILTDKYLADSRDKNRLHRLLQISKNKKVITKIVNSATTAGERISQFGGIVFFGTPAEQRAD